MRKWRDDKGTALMEAAVTLPILLLIAVGIFEFGRAFQTWQVLTNAAREGARVACTAYPPPNNTIEARVRQYLQDGQLQYYDTARISVNRSATVTINGVTRSASLVTVDYDFQFIVLNPVARLINPQSTTGQNQTMRATALMRNESGT